MMADDREGSDAQGQQESAAGKSSAKDHDPSDKRPGPGSDVIATNAPILSPRPADASGWQKQPASTMTVETGKVGELAAGPAPGIMIVPYEENVAPKSPSRRKDDRREEDKDAKGISEGRQSERQPSLMHSLLLPGVVALVCGIVGALGYSYFFIPSKSGDQGSSSQKSESSKESSSSSKKGSGAGGSGGAGSNPGGAGSSSS